MFGNNAADAVGLVFIASFAGYVAVSGIIASLITMHGQIRVKP